MKLDRDSELTMLKLKVKPKIQEVRECLRAGKTEEIFVTVKVTGGMK